jgi:ParB family chromosome partitioning protein
LSASIRQHGLLQPITVYKEGYDYIVKTGHRRYQAYRLLFEEEKDRFHSIRCIVSNADNIAIVQLVENVQREDLSQIDLFNALSDLRNQGMSLKQIADVMGKKETYVRKIFVAVNEIQANDRLQEAVCFAGVTLDDVVETKGIPDENTRLELLKQRKTGQINRAEMRKKAKSLKGNTTTKPVLGGSQTKNKRMVSLLSSPEKLQLTLTFVDRELFDGISRDIKDLLKRYEIVFKIN